MVSRRRRRTRQDCLGRVGQRPLPGRNLSGNRQERRSIDSRYLVAGWQALTSPKERLARMTAIAKASQLALLPPVPPEMTGINIAARYRSATRDASVGGDLYEIIPASHGIRAVIGDVATDCEQALDTLMTAVHRHTGTPAVTATTTWRSFCWNMAHLRPATPRKPSRGPDRCQHGNCPPICCHKPMTRMPPVQASARLDRLGHMIAGIASLTTVQRGQGPAGQAEARWLQLRALRDR